MKLFRPSKNLRLGVVVFITGAVVMALELAGSRVLAPFLGTSIFVWTSLIGVILGSLSLGYWLGGRYADEKASFEKLAATIIGASLFVGLIVPLHYPLLALLSTRKVDLRLGGIVAALLLFAAPSVLLGMITPIAVRLRLSGIEHSGSEVGRLYALSTLGSLAGTFAAGFFIFAYIGTVATILLLAAMLLVAAVCAAPRPVWIIAVCAIIAAFAWFARSMESDLEKRGLLDLDTAYQRALVLTQQEAGTGRPYRLLITDMLGSQSMMYLDAPGQLAGQYTQYFHLVFDLVPHVKRILMIGGGAYTVPKHFAANYPALAIDVVEIDPGITEIARTHFALKQTPNLQILHEDARTYLPRAVGLYDAVFLDAFQSSPSVPFHLTTVEAMTLIKNALKERGVFLMNVISSIEGREGRFFRAERATVEKVFGGISAFAVSSVDDPHLVQNLILAAGKPPLQPDAMNIRKTRYAGNLWTKSIAGDAQILTDNYAPVEIYMLPAYLKWMEQNRRPDAPAAAPGTDSTEDAAT